MRLPGGEFIEVHEPLDEYERYKLVDFESSYRSSWSQRHGDRDRRNRRAPCRRWFFEDRLAPATQAELERAHGHHEATPRPGADSSTEISH